MQVYLVGGAVRDQLLGLPQTDRDWLVVGATPEQLIQQGFQQVGKNFPVFLHPQTKEEYALARREKKQGQGYTGFICDFSPDISLEEDLKRRDLTINAMAQDKQGKLFDPYKGKQDLNNKLLRHVSHAFIEDPLRVLRVARFAARFADLGFTIAPETLHLMQQICHLGELHHLTIERIWQETEKALQTNCPWIYFDVLEKIDALPQLFPELSHIPLKKTLATDFEKKQSFLPETADLPKGLSAFVWLFSSLSEKSLQTFCQRLKVPHLWQEMTKNYQRLTLFQQQKPTAECFLALLNQLDSWRKTEQFIQLLTLFSSLNDAEQEVKKLWFFFTQCQQINVQQIIQAGFEKAEIKQELQRQRLALIEKLLNQSENS